MSIIREREGDLPSVNELSEQMRFLSDDPPDHNLIYSALVSKEKTTGKLWQQNIFGSVSNKADTHCFKANVSSISNDA